MIISPHSCKTLSFPIGLIHIVSLLLQRRQTRFYFSHFHSKVSWRPGRLSKLSQVTHLRIQPSPLDSKPQILYPRTHWFYWKVPLAGSNANNIPIKTLSWSYHWSESNKEWQEAISTVEIGKAGKFTHSVPRSAWCLSDGRWWLCYIPCEEDTWDWTKRCPPQRPAWLNPQQKWGSPAGTGWMRESTKKQERWVQDPALILSSCVTTGKVTSLSEAVLPSSLVDVPWQSLS